MSDTKKRILSVAFIVSLGSHIAGECATEAVAINNAGGGQANSANINAATSFGLGASVEWARSQSYLWQGGILYPSTQVSSSSDSDNDGLSDWSEATGSSFQPVTKTSSTIADSDDDGVLDGDEARAGTNPYDAISLFEMIDQIRAPQGIVVRWTARSGQMYDVIVSGSATNIVSGMQIVTSLYATGGVGPWYETIQVWTNTQPQNGVYTTIRKR